MNVSELARRLKVTPNELLAKLPGLGFAVGERAIKIDDIVAEKIFRKWIENERRERMRSSLMKSDVVRPGAEPVVKTDIVLPSVMVVRDLAGKLKLPVTRVILQLMKAGILASQNERLDFETAAIIAEELGFNAKKEEEKAETADQSQAQDRMREIMDSEVQETLVPRAPVIVVMGHVDHGKTKTLDAIRSTNIMGGEAGGITQHIGAYQAVKKDRAITFIDTPGHEAFTVMRSRGAKVADIAILVVAADDGVQPQTKEAINIIKAAGLPFVVALNKIDKADADVDRVLAQLGDAGVTTEAWGGTIPLVKISAKTGAGIDDLLDVVLLVADLNADKIRANPARLAVGTVIESHVDKGEGPVATVLVQSGTLKKNDWIGISNAAYGRVRAMRDWTGKMINEAPPGTPVKILGFKVAPAMGDILEVPADPKSLEMKAKTSHQVAESFTAKKQMPTEGDEGKAKKVMYQPVMRTDVLGSLEALLGMMEKVRHDDVGVEVIQKGLGNVTEADVIRAAGASKVIYAFNVVPGPKVAATARDKGVEIRSYKVVYELFDDVVAELNKILKPEITITQLGTFETIAIFRTEPHRMVIGGRVTNGKVLPNEKARVWRPIPDSDQFDPLGDVTIESIQIGKASTKEAYGGTECGLSIKGKVKVQPGDRLEVFHEDVKERKVVIER
jgi:translation initiation factor IF-2